MVFYAIILLIQILCIVHVIRNGRNQLWIMALIFLPVASAAAYFIVEILPGLSGNRHVRAARAKAIQTLDPERELRAARDQLALADTIANRTRLADAYVGLARYGEALPLYREIAGRGEPDAPLRLKLARALFETGASEEALATIEAVEEASTQGERDRRGMLRARILEALGRAEEAMALYADIVTRLPGEEARCRYAALLLAKGRTGEARRVLEEVETRMKRLSRQQRAAEADMYSWAMEKMAELRAAGG
ncbi:MAG: hypothetical protein H7X93_04165 [Sphingomonadaceae bacterium]|nr:hypothetical protein [Sphingomonadaceae bacterium]